MTTIILDRLEEVGIKGHFAIKCQLALHSGYVIIVRHYPSNSKKVQQQSSSCIAPKDTLMRELLECEIWPK